ncbi:MAG TPA: lipoate--protein ligase [Mobilitalea sp.]|nr:lipoate--protein ligase [Mobilitalea sp.]
MNKAIKYIITDETNPYKNLALEEYLLHQVGDEECILYLWQNERTVVIGRNQNPWKECRLKELEADGGRLVRRLSGGGAVFHDLGNLNFTFLAAKDNYDVDKQLEVIVKAVNRLGIPAVKSGRNDITVDGRKFSGNAFYSDGKHCYHHGTLLVDVDMTKLSLYLNVSKDKLVSKGVDSVKSRVTNLREYAAELTIEKMKERLISAFGEVYSLTPTLLELPEDDSLIIQQLEEKFSSWDWKFGRKMEFSDSLSRRFTWGDIEIKLVVEAGIIKECAVYSDALETELLEQLPVYLKGSPFTARAMVEALERVPLNTETTIIMIDIKAFISEYDL